MKHLITIIKGVEENNQKNGGSWSDWIDSKHIFDVYLNNTNYDNFYGSFEEIKYLLDKAIETNGKSLENDLFDLKNKLGLI